MVWRQPSGLQGNCRTNVPRPITPPGFEEAWRKRFEQFATSRDDDAGIAGWSEFGLHVRLRRFAREFSYSSPRGRWLDAGCGAGTYSRFLASEGLQVLGLDYCLPAAIKAKARGTGTCLWAVADVTRLPLRPGGFDGVLCFGVLQALTNSGPAVHELAGQVASGGELWIDVLNGACIANLIERFSRKLRGKPVHLRYESPAHVKQLMREAGLDRIRVCWIPIMPRRLRWLQPALETAAARRLLQIFPGLGLLLSHSCLLSGRRADARK